MKRFLLSLGLLLTLVVGTSAQTTFTTTLGAAANWTTATWVKTGAPSNATYPGATGYAGELPGDVHHVVILTSDANARVLTLNVNTIVSHVGNVVINNAPGVATLALGNNSLPILGSVSGAGTLTFGTGTLSLTGDLVGHTGTFTIGTGTVNYNGVNQTVKAQTYFNLTLSNSGSKTVNGNVTVSGNLLVNNGTTLDLGATATTYTTTGTSTINGSFDFGSTLKAVTLSNNLLGNGIINMSGVGLAHTLSLSGATNSFSGTLNTTDASASTITYAPNAAQTIFASPNYQNLTIAGGNTKTLNGDAVVKGNLTVTAGTLSFGATLKTVTVNGNLSGAGAITMQGAGIAHILNLYGTSNAIGALNSSAGSGSTISYLALGDQSVFASANYRNLNIGGSGIKTIANANITINDNLDVTGSTFAFNGTTGRTIDLIGNLSGTGAIDMSGGNLGHVLNLWGTNNSIGALITSPTGASTISYSRAGNQQVFASLNYRNLSTAGSGIKSLQGASNIYGTLSLTGTSTLFLNGNALGIDGNTTVNAGCTLSVNSNSVLSMAANTSITSAGNISIVGTSGNVATLTRKGATGGYTITQNGGTSVFSAQYYAIDYLRGAGIGISAGTIDPLNNFSNGSFSNGIGSYYLNFTTTSDLSGVGSIVNTVFNAGAPVNVFRTTGTGKLTFVDASGAQAGESFDQDNGNPGTLIDWTFPSNVFYSKGNLPAGLTTSWGKNPDGSGANPSNLTDAQSTFIIRDGNTMTLDNSGDLKALSLQIGQGTSGALIIGQNATARTLTIQNDLTVMAGGSVSMGSGATHKVVMLSGSIINNGTFDLMGSGVSYAGVTMWGTSQIQGTNKPKFSNLTLETTAFTTLAVDVDVAKNLLFKAGSKFTDGGKSLSVGGNYDNLTGVAANVTLTGSAIFYGSTSTISNGSTVTTFNNLSFTSPNGFISETAIVNGDFLVTSSSSVVTLTGKTLTFNKGFQVDGGSSFLSNGAVDFASTLAQSIVLSGTSSFATLSFTNGGANAKTITGDFAASNTVTQNSNTTVAGAGTYTISNNLTINGTCNWSGKIIQKGGTIRTTNASNTLSLGTAELDIQGGVDLNYAGPATSVALSINNNVTITSGHFVLNPGTTMIGQPSRTLKVITLLYVRGSDNFPTGFGTYDLTPNITAQVRYDQNINQTIRGGLTYGVLTVTSGGTKTVDGSLDVNGNFALGASTTLDLLNYSHTFAGDVAVNASGVVDGGNATMALDAPDLNQTISGGTITLKNLSIDQSAATGTRTKTLAAGMSFTLNGDLTVLNSSGSPSILLTLDIGSNIINGPSGNFSLGNYCQLNTQHIDFYTDVINNFVGTFNVALNSTVNYNRNGNQIIADGLTYGNLVLTNAIKTARGSLNVDGNISGAALFEDAGFTHTLAGNWGLAGTSYGLGSATGTIVLDGVNQIIGGQTFNNLTVSTSGLADMNNDLTLLGNLIVNTGSVIDFSVRNLNMKGNITVLGTGLFTQTTGTTTFSGVVDQTITLNGVSTLGSLAVAKPASSAKTKLTALTDLKIARNTDINTDAGILDITNRTINFGGHITINDNDSINSTNFIAAGATVNLNGVTDQYLRSRSGYAVTVKDLYFSGSGNKVFGTLNNGRTPNVIGNDSIVVTGNFEIAGANVNNNPSALNGGSNVYLYGDWINSGTFSHPGNATVHFMGVDQSISASDFYNVNIKGSGNKVLSGAIKVNNNLVLTSANLDCNNFAISIGANWNNSTGTFTPRSSTVVFTGTTGSTITTGTTTGIAAGKGFYNIEINKSGGGATLAGDLEVQNDFLLSASTFTTNTYDIWIKGNFDNQGGIFSHNNNASIITLNATSGVKTFRPSYPAQSPVTTLRGVAVNAPGATYNVASEFTVQQIDMNILAGDFILNKNIVNVIDNNRRILVNGGKLHVDSASVINFVNTGGGITLNSGELHVVGNSVNTSKLSSSAGSFIVNQTGGTLFVRNYDILNGIFNITGGTLNATDNFSDGSFSGYNAGGATTAYVNLDAINLGAGISIANVIFNSGTTPAITPKYNIYRATGTGAVNLADAAGSYAGESYEKDNGVPGTLVNWTYPLGIYWDGGGFPDLSWENKDNWSSNLVPKVTDIAYLDHKYMLPKATPYKIHVTSNTATAQKVMMDAQGGGNIELIIDANAKLAVVEDLQILTNTTVTQTDATALLEVGTNWSNTGVFNHGNSTVTFNGNGGISNISAGGVGAGKAFYNLTVNAPLAVYSLTNAAKIDGNVTITNGTLDLYGGNNDIQVGGNWFVDLVNGGDFLSSTADVTFNGTNQSITNGNFYNLITSNSGTKSLLSNIRVKNSVTIGAGTTFAGSTYDLYVGGNWVNNGLFSQSGLGSVTFDGTAAQSIDNGGLGTTFNHLLFSNGGVKTFFKNQVVNGNVTINPASGIINLDTYSLTGVGATNSLTSNATIEIRGASNFPTGFETINLAAASTVSYISNLAQSVYATTYGNLTLSRITVGTPSIKTVLGDITVAGTITVNAESTLNFASNDASVILTGNFGVATGAFVTWGTTNSTLTHIGGDINLDLDITSFNHLILGGTGDKWMQGNFTMTGDLRVKSGVDLFMCTAWTRTNFWKITGDGSNSVILESGSRILNTRPSSDGPAIPENFATYSFDSNSNYRFWANNGIDQTIYTGAPAGTQIVYGNIYNDNNKAITVAGNFNLRVDGTFDLNAGTNATLADGGKNIDVRGANIFLSNYTPSSSSIIFTLNGNANQYLRNYNVDNTIDFANVVFAGGGTKTLGDGNDNFSVTSNFTINSGIIVTTGRDISMSGANWINNGTFTQSGGTVTYNSLSPQSINPGAPSASNYFNALAFANGSTKAFVTNGADVNSTFSIFAGTVDMGNLLFHNIAGNIVNTTGGTLLASLANITFDGGNQNIQTPNFNVGNITTAGTGTKRLFSNWTVNNNVLISSGSTLNTNDGLGMNYNISVGGHWVNNGTFTGNTSTVTFNGINSQTDILAGTGNFYDVVFGTNASVYKLLSPTTRFSRSMILGANAELNLNENSLILGSNIAAGKTFDIFGTLHVNKNAYLKFNNVTSKSVMTIKSGGTLKVVGLNSTTLASLTREVAGVAGAETQITVESGGTLAAKYYLIEYLQDAGMDCQLGSILDPVNNLSEGNWANVRNVANAKYLKLESNYVGADIVNCAFAFTATPTVGVNYNVERKLAGTPITFASVGGALGSYKYEVDDEALPAAATGLLHWPAVTETNWTGAISTDWHDAGNWDNGVPTATIDAFVSDKANDPTISLADAFCKKLEISNGQVTLSGGKSLTATSDLTVGTAALGGQLIVGSTASNITVGGSWKRGTAGVFIHGGGTVLFNSPSSAVNIDPGTQKFNNVTFDGPNAVFSLIGGAITFDGKVNIQNGEVIPANNNYSHVVKGDFYVRLGAIFTPTGGGVGAGTITLSGANQSITNGIFHSLVVAGTGTKTVNGVTTINGSTTVNSNLAASSGAPITWLGNVTFNPGSSFIDGGETHIFKGVYWYGNGTYSGNGIVTFSGATQYITNGRFSSVILEGTAALYFYGNIQFLNNITIKNGPTIYLHKDAVITNTTGTGLLLCESTNVIYVRGVNNFPSGFSTYNMGATAVFYDSPFDQTIYGVDYYGLYLSGLNTTKTLSANIKAKGGLTIGNSILDVSSNNYTINIAGTWTNNSATGGVFIQRQGTVTFDGAVNQNINVGASNANDFYNLVIANSGVTSSNTVTVNWPTTNLRTIFNNLTVSSGIYNANGRIQTIGGDLVVSGTGQLTANNDFTLNKASGSASIATNGSVIRNIVFNGNASYNAGDDITILGNFTQNSGTFNGNGKSISFGDNTDVMIIKGTYQVGANGKLIIGGASGVTVETTGRFELVGSGVGIAMVTNNPSYTGNGRYTFTVDGTIAAKNYAFEWMGSGGINLSTTSTIDATNNLSDGTFSNGAGSQPLLVVQNSQSFTAPSYIANVTFPTNAGGTAKNVKKTNGAGTLEFYNATGLFAGATYEDDPASLINWTGPLTLTWNGSVGTDWNNATNWTASSGPAIVPTGDEDVIIPSGVVNMPILTTFGQKTANLKIANGAKITLNTPADGGAIDLDIKGDLNLIGNILPQSADDYINLTGSWTKTGTGAAVLGTVSFSGTGSSKTINNGVGAFNYITIGGSTVYQISTLTTINNDLVILSGATFGSGANQLIVNGNWSNSGTFLSSTGTVRLKAASGSKTISNGTSVFNNLDINAPSAIYQLLSNITVNGNLDLTNGTLNLNNYTLKVGDNAGSDFLNIYGKLVANGTSKINMVGTAGTPAKLIVYGGGYLDMVGTNDTNVAAVYSSTGGRYDFSVESGGKLDAKYYSVANTTSSGLNIKSGAIVSTLYNLSNGTFSNGLSGYSYLTLGHEMAVNDTIRSVVFNAGAQYNVSRASGTTEFAFVDAGGAMGGYTFENDMGGVPDATTGLLRWDTQSLYTWLGLSDDWSTSTNWFNNVLPNSLANVTINSGKPFNPIIKTGANITIGDLDIKAGATLTVASGAKLTISGATTNDGTFVIQNQPNAMASVIPLGTFTGNAQIENTLPNNRYWYMGNAVSNLNSGIYDAADAVNTFAYKYTTTWVRYTNNVTPLEASPLVGYSHKFLLGKTVVAVGPLNNSNYTIPVPNNSWTLVANPYSSTVDMGSNYVSSVANWMPSGKVDPNIWVPTHGAVAGSPLQFATYNLSTGLAQNGGSKFIAPQQAFWVKNPNAIAGTFAMYKTARTHDTTVKLKSSTPTDADDVLRLTVENSFAKDEVVFAFRSVGSDVVTTSDSEKRLSTDAKVVNIYSIKDSKYLAINCKPELAQATTIPLGLSVGATGAGVVKIVATNIIGFLPTYNVVLEDLSTSQFYDLRVLPFVELTVVAGTANNRLVLHLNPMANPINPAPSFGGITTGDSNEIRNVNQTISISSVNNKARVEIISKDSIDATIDLYSATGEWITRYKTTAIVTDITLPDVTQIYIVRVTSGNLVKSSKVMK